MKAQTEAGDDRCIIYRVKDLEAFLNTRRFDPERIG
jgi:hypothetical protein